MEECSAGDDLNLRRADDVVGGIDLSTADSGMMVRKDNHGGVKMDFNPAMIARIRQEGVQSAVPVIIDVTSMNPAQISPLLGFNFQKSMDYTSKLI